MRKSGDEFPKALYLKEVAEWSHRADFVELKGLHAQLVDLAKRAQIFADSLKLEEDEGYGEVIEHRRGDDATIVSIAAL